MVPHTAYDAYLRVENLVLDFGAKLPDWVEAIRPMANGRRYNGCTPTVAHEPPMY